MQIAPTATVMLIACQVYIGFKMMSDSKYNPQLIMKKCVYELLNIPI